eukprot:5677837-Amphidinium_carterae.1
MSLSDLLNIGRKEHIMLGLHVILSAGMNVRYRFLFIMHVSICISTCTCVSMLAHSAPWDCHSFGLWGRSCAWLKNLWQRRPRQGAQSIGGSFCLESGCTIKTALRQNTMLLQMLVAILGGPSCQSLENPRCLYAHLWRLVSIKRCSGTGARGTHACTVSGARVKPDHRADGPFDKAKVKALEAILHALRSRKRTQAQSMDPTPEAAKRIEAQLSKKDKACPLVNLQYQRHILNVGCQAPPIGALPADMEPHRSRGERSRRDEAESS